MDEIPTASGDSVDSKISREAAEWLLRIDEDDTPECRSRFVEWLENSPRHMEEFLLATATSRVIRQLDPERRIDVTQTPADVPHNVVGIHGAGGGICGVVEPDNPALRSPPKRSRRPYFGLAAAVVAAFGFLAWIWPFNSTTYSTAVGEQRSFQMEDGSFLHLNTQSRVKVSYSEKTREVQLLEGEALFEVAHDPGRPFRVHAGAAVIQAVGTQFNVYRRQHETTVSVVEGKVAIEPIGHPHPSATLPPSPLGGEGRGEGFLRAGEEAAIEGDGRVVRHAAPDVVAAVAWRQHRLVFRSSRLDDIAVQFNRYNRLTIRIEGDITAEQRMSGTFNANEPDAFVRFLQQDPTLSIERTNATVTVRSR